jgi:TonB-linked SusC/RagA family outer membrane protein
MKICLPKWKATSGNGYRHSYSKKMKFLFLFVVLSSTVLAQKQVSGKVSIGDSALSGVTIQVKGTTIVTQTDANGNYTINAPADATLVFSSVGYGSQEVKVNNRSTLNVQMQTTARQMNEVIVVGYGTQRRGSVTGAISNIKSEDITRTTATTTSGALVGKIQGITARQGDARPGAGTSIQIRNLGAPLYVIDGIPSDEGQFNNLGIEDVESISILKDASAAVYGLRASNGVILVTTKKGRAGAKPAINVSGYYGISNFTRYPKPANAYQYLRGLLESGQNGGAGVNITPEELEKWRVGTEKGYQSFDYYDMVMRPNVPQYYANASASGGSERMNYYFSVSHVNQDALIRDFSFSRTNFQANLDVGLAKGLKIGTQLSGRLEDRFQVGVPGLDDYFNPLLSIFTMWPTERPYANDNPNFINQTHNVNVNPATYKKEITGYIDEIWRAAKGNFYAQYDFGFGLTAKGTYSYNFTNFDFDGFEYTYNAYQYDPATDTYKTDPAWGNQNPWRERRKRNIVDRFAQFQLNYNKRFGDHSIAAVAAYERSDNDNKYLVVHTVPPNNYIPLMSFANQDLLIDELGVEARAGYIGKINYDFKKRYLIELMGRYDGSFLYAPGSRYGFFPGISLGWRVVDEPFFKDNLGKVFSDLKFRASYGQMGNDRVNNTDFVVPPFSYIQGYDFLSGSSIFDGNYVIGVRPRGLPITSLSWITSTSKNIGFDFGFFQNRLTGQFDVFERERTGLPAPRYDVLLPTEVGYTLPQENLNEDAHRGIEGVLTYANHAGNVNYSLGVNATVSRLRSISTYKPRFANSWHEYRSSIEDRWANINWGYQVEGQFKSQEEIDNYPVNVDGQGNRTLLPGDLIYKDVNGDGIINELDERPIGYAEGANPYMSFGINGRVGYKGFTLQFDFAGANMQTFNRYWELRFPYQNNGNSPEFMLEDRWHRADPFDPNSEWVAGFHPPLRKNGQNHSSYVRHSDFWLTNVRYIRLRNLELGYNFDKNMISRMGLNTLRVYVNASNLFSIDNVKKYGIDPEIGATNGLVYPQQRVINFGLNLSL